MKKLSLILIITTFCCPLFANHLYPEHYSLKSSRFCLDCDTIQAMPNVNIWKELIAAFNKKALYNDDGSKPEDLSYTFKLINSQNSQLPENMSRAIAIDDNGVIWMGTDNGLALYDHGKMTVLKADNSPLEARHYNENLTSTIFNMIADKQGTVWIIQGWNVFRVKDGQWEKFDTLNSPVQWGRNMFVDDQNNVWITSWDGVCKYDGTKWSVVDTANSTLPTNKVLSFSIDRQSRQWYGTFSGNALFDGRKWTDLRQDKSILGKKYIDAAYQDAKGNMWFTFFADRKDNKGGLSMLDTLGKWHHYAPSWTTCLEREGVNDFLFDESRQQIWIAINTIGLAMYDVARDKWEIYTPSNSKLPSGYVMRLTQDEQNNIWGASFGGFFKIVQ